MDDSATGRTFTEDTRTYDKAESDLVQAVTRLDKAIVNAQQLGERTWATLAPITGPDSRPECGDTLKSIESETSPHVDGLRDLAQRLEALNSRSETLLARLTV